MLWFSCRKPCDEHAYLPSHGITNISNLRNDAAPSTWMRSSFERICRESLKLGWSLAPWGRKYFSRQTEKRPQLTVYETLAVCIIFVMGQLLQCIYDADQSQFLSAVYIRRFFRRSFGASGKCKRAQIDMYMWGRPTHRCPCFFWRRCRWFCYIFCQKI